MYNLGDALEKMGSTNERLCCNLLGEIFADFGRNKVVALALLCGSDYSSGVHGVGKDSALKFFERVSEKDVLQRMRAWKEDPVKFEQMQRRIADKTVCSSCGHLGSVQAHTRKGFIFNHHCNCNRN